jgi:integrin beta 3
LPGRDGKDGIDGKDGANGRDGVPGERGPQGIGFHAVEQFETEDEWGIRFKCDDEDDRVFSWKKPERPTLADFYQGTWKKDQSYARGSLVTWGGSLYIALADEVKDQPSTSSEWQMCVKKGRDGRDGKDGKSGPPGPKGEAGKDLTQLGLDGKKW